MPWRILFLQHASVGGGYDFPRGRACNPVAESMSCWLFSQEIDGIWGKLMENTRPGKQTNIAIPICSMYGIFTNICPINDTNVGKYTIHGVYGIEAMAQSK